MSNRASPSHLHQHEAVRFGQLFTYESPHAIEETMGVGYFTPCKDRLRPGDEVRICYVVADRLRERQDIVVAAKSSAGIEIYPIGKRIVVPEPKVEKPGPLSVLPSAAMEVRRGYQCFQLFYSDSGKVIAEYGTKAEAEAAMAELQARTEKAA